MLPYKRILWPTDFSEPSYVALEAASELGKHFSAELWAVHVVTPLLLIPAAPVTFNVAKYTEELREASEKGLNDVVQQKGSARYWWREVRPNISCAWRRKTTSI